MGRIAVLETGRHVAKQERQRHVLCGVARLERFNPDVDFEQFSSRKIRDAERARIAQLTTVKDVSDGEAFRVIGNDWTRAHYSGEFTLVQPARTTAVSLVFVQSSDGNTVVADPSVLGGGDTDKHLIYEGLSRVAADGVLAGAGSLHAESVMSVWHPELIALRASLKLPRHPAQIVISRRADFDFEALMFNVPEVRVFLIAPTDNTARHEAALRARPWIRHVPLLADNLQRPLDVLRDEEGIHRISAIGGRQTATALVDAGLVQDLHLTTAPRRGGKPNTPWYGGSNRLALTTLVRKEWFDEGALVFEHIRIGRIGL